MSDKKPRIEPEKVETRGAFDWAKHLSTPDAAFQSADIIYGWSKQAYHYQAEKFLLSESDYTQALEASAKFPTVRPHEPAVAKVHADNYKSFKPLKAK